MSHSTSDRDAALRAECVENVRGGAFMLDKMVTQLWDVPGSPTSEEYSHLRTAAAEIREALADLEKYRPIRGRRRRAGGSMGQTS